MSPVKQSRREKAAELLARAQRVGFLVAPGMTDPALGPYTDWCRDQDRPWVWVRNRNSKRYAVVSLSLEGCSWVLSPEARERVVRVLGSVRRQPHAVVYWKGDRLVAATGIPVAVVERVAFELFECAWDCRPVA